MTLPTATQILYGHLAVAESIVQYIDDNRANSALDDYVLDVILHNTLDSLKLVASRMKNLIAHPVL